MLFFVGILIDSEGNPLKTYSSFGILRILISLLFFKNITTKKYISLLNPANVSLNWKPMERTENKKNKINMELWCSWLRPNVASTCNHHQDLHTNNENSNIPLKHKTSFWHSLAPGFYVRLGFVGVLSFQSIKLETLNHIRKQHQTRKLERNQDSNLDSKGLNIGVRGQAVLCFGDSPNSQLLCKLSNKHHTNNDCTTLQRAITVFYIINSCVWHCEKTTALVRDLRTALGPVPL